MNGQEPSPQFDATHSGSSPPPPAYPPAGTPGSDAAASAPPPWARLGQPEPEANGLPAPPNQQGSAPNGSAPGQAAGPFAAAAAPQAPGNGSASPGGSSSNLPPWIRAARASASGAAATTSPAAPATVNSPPPPSGPAPAVPQASAAPAPAAAPSLPWQPHGAAAQPAAATPSGPAAAPQATPLAGQSQAPAGPAAPPTADAAPPDAEQHEDWFRSPSFVRTSAAFLSSTVFHLVAMIVLALWMVPIAGDALLMLTVSPEPETILLEDRLQPSMEMAWEDSADMLLGSAGQASPDDAFARVDWSTISADPLDGQVSVLPESFEHIVGKADMLTERGATPGLPRVVVGDYRQALDHITQEVLKLLAKRDVLLIWCFDESESMKDDQEQIVGRIERVYAELGMTGATKGESLTTGVTSFGQGFQVHTPHPTTDVEAIKEAIGSLPVCPSGHEFMCNAVVQSINTFRNHARAENRQLALILVSDESGEPEETDQYLEATVQHAKAAPCPVYVLGREAAFGQHLARVRWDHPQTGKTHWLPIDRGPESAFIEQLQTDGFGRREDAHPSGFGPYAQSRLAMETGGKFFMLPSKQSNLAWSGERRYSPLAIDAYRPDLSSRHEVMREINQRPLRHLITQVVHDLNPDRSESADLMGIREDFSGDRAEAKRQLEAARSKAIRYYSGLKRAIDSLESEKANQMREEEPSKRWQANYDLMRAQALAYAARVYLYGAALEDAMDRVDEVPATRGEEHLARWRIRHREGLPIDSNAAELLARAQQYYLDVIANHRDTPWAARAEWELQRVFGYPGVEEAAEQLAAAGATAGDAAHLDEDAMALRAIAANLELGVGTGPGVGVGGGGGGGGGGGAGWGVDFVQGMELVPEYRVPPRPREPQQGGGGRRPDRRPEPPAEPRIPIPKL